MGPTDHQRTFLNAIQAGDWNTVASYLSDDFQFSGPVPEPVGKEAWLGLMQAYEVAFPDIKYNFELLGAEGNVTGASNQLTGTHTNDLDLTFMGMGVIPATGKSFSQPRQEGEATWDGDKVVSVHIHATPEEGLMALLAQLGVEPPPSP